MKIEASLFRGREPDQFRYDIESGKLNSGSVRLSYNPSNEWALQVSYGHIVSGEQLAPLVNINRSTASAIYSTTIDGNNWQTTFAWGRNMPSVGNASSAYLLESAYRINDTHTWFARLEHVGKNELFGESDARAEQIYQINKLSLGVVYDFPSEQHVRFGVGAAVGLFSFPDALNDTYGAHPGSYTIFARVKFN